MCHKHEYNYYKGCYDRKVTIGNTTIIMCQSGYDNKLWSIRVNGIVERTLNYMSAIDYYTKLIKEKEKETEKELNYVP